MSIRSRRQPPVIKVDNYCANPTCGRIVARLHDEVVIVWARTGRRIYHADCVRLTETA